MICSVTPSIAVATSIQHLCGRGLLLRLS